MLINIIDDLNFYITLIIVLPMFAISCLDFQKWKQGKEGNKLSVYCIYLNAIFYLVLIYVLPFDEISIKAFIRELDMAKRMSLFAPITVGIGVTNFITAVGVFIKFIARRRKEKLVEIKLFDNPSMCLDELNNKLSCKYCEIVCNSSMICESILEKIKLYLRQNKVVIVDFYNVYKVDFGYVYRLYVYAYREIKKDELIDRKLIVKNIPYQQRLEIEKIKKQACENVWGAGC